MFNVKKIQHGSQPFKKPHTPLTTARVQQMYEHLPSFTDFLPWMEYLPEGKAFLLEDGRSVGAFYEVTPVSCEAKPEAFLVHLRDQIQSMLVNSFSEEPVSPWVVQVYVQDEPTLQDTLTDIIHYRSTLQEAIHLTRYKADYLKWLSRHLADLARPGGLFIDPSVTGLPFRGTRRTTRVVIYRCLTAKTKLRPGFSPVDDLNTLCGQFQQSLSAAGLHWRRGTGENFYTWMVRWFNPAPEAFGSDIEALLAAAPYPGDEVYPVGTDFSDPLIHHPVRSDAQKGTWYFDELPHRVMTLQGFSHVPSVGHLTAERQRGDKHLALLDRLPEGSIVVMTLVIEPQDHILEKIEKIKKSAIGDSADALHTIDEADFAQKAISANNKLFPLTMAVFLRGKTERELRDNLLAAHALLVSDRLLPIRDDYDPLALDAYLRHLPMNYRPALDKQRKRSRLVYVEHTANLMPFYGRSRGTGHPGFLFYNRGGEAFTFDPFNSQDKNSNSHMLLLGPTGSGKSALCNYLVLQVIFHYNPRMFIIEKGGSFRLLAAYLREQGFSVNEVQLSPNTPLSLNPFSEALKILDQAQKMEELFEEKVLDEDTPTADVQEDDVRDYLGEMATIAQLMITGGEDKELDRFTRQDRLTIRKALIKSAMQARDAGKTQVLPRDLVRVLQEEARAQEGRVAQRTQEMADGLHYFCTGSMAQAFFDREGDPWPEHDVTIVDVGIMATQGYEAELAVAYTGIMNKITALAELHQYDRDHRDIIVLTDEGHIITKNKLLASVLVKIGKMGRKLGLWLWNATQNLTDFPDEARQLLTLMEFWVCLAMEKDEVHQVARFKSLTEEEHELLLSARKVPGLYTEGVVLSRKMKGLFRNVPPSLCLALAMTEKIEKAQRAEIMEKEGCTELQAAYRVAEQLDAKRREKRG